MTFTIIAFYKFIHLEDRTSLRASLKEFSAAHGICGSILLAPEGINATIAGAQEAIDAFLGFLRSDERFADIETKVSYVEGRPFGKMKVRLKKEIITFGDPDAANAARGIYVKPVEWNALISRPDVTVVDTRNEYEVAMGTFERAIDPCTDSFTEFKKFVSEKLDPQRDKQVAMFCTGGIRCEKATAYLLKHGFENVYHLQGGILKYLEEIPRDQSLFRGECYVFDNRITVSTGVEPGNYEAVPHTDNEYVKKG